jgi:hypothetical protein
LTKECIVKRRKKIEKVSMGGGIKLTQLQLNELIGG